MKSIQHRLKIFSLVLATLVLNFSFDEKLWIQLAGQFSWSTPPWFATHSSRIARPLLTGTALSKSTIDLDESTIDLESLNELKSADDLQRVVVRRAGDDDSQSYRIPGLTVTPRGTLIACFDIRWQGAGDLPATIDVGARRSSNGGLTWEKMIIAIDYPATDPNSRGNGVGDAAIFLDRDSGDVFLAALWSYGDRGWNGSGPGLKPDETGQLVIARSRDDGVTWEPPIAITEQIKQPQWKLCFQGPGAGIQLRDGTLVFPAQFRDAGGKPSSCFIWSDDPQRLQWQISSAAIPDNPPTSESQLVQCADGSLLMTMRNESREPERLWSRWTWRQSLGQGQWSEPWTAVRDPVCMAGLVAHPTGVILLAHNDSNRRERLTIRASHDNGRTWAESRVLDNRPTGYSCLTVLPNGDIGVLYEVGDQQSYETLTFARFPLKWLTDRGH